MTNPFVRKLEHGADLKDEDRRNLEQAVREVRAVDADRDVISQGEKPEHVHVIMGGFAVRYKTLADGKRQIMAFLVPGDMCDLHVQPSRPDWLRVRRSWAERSRGAT